ncbi:nitroreductase family protein [Konateibacter massiliensis]|uniref:nitroreductase family protein n=1 Tax=Konateibacter massiliensis TaxID=2002841 RepID=UPI000C160B26|nr:nitroreductase family protein [Konateibacter massiliensis]
MNTIECIKSRRSVREFTDQKVSHPILEQIVEAASFSPSWKNTQISRYVVVEDNEIKQNIMEYVSEGNKRILAGTQTLVVVTYIKNRSGFERDGSYTTKKEGSWQMFDAGVASQTFCLAAHELGVGSVIMGIFDEDEIARVIDLSEDRAVAALIAIGYETEHPNAPKRKTVEDLLEYK